MKKTVFMILTLVFATAFAMAQSVEDGIRLLYYEKNKSAKETLQKVVTNKPKDGYSIYWLGQALIASEDYAGAKTLYQNALTSGVNDPWIWIGTGHVELLQGGDINAAKQRFEQAITSTKGKRGAENANILNAIGRANADGGNKVGDPNYAIEKLKRAQQIDTKNPDIDINLGINYLKLGSEHGGEAVEAFRDAAVRDPKYARAYTRIGRVYRSQDNKESMNEWYGKAIATDATYGPVYLDYFLYYQNRDVNAAKEYLDKYVANADKDCKTDYWVADYLFRAGKYQESINKANEMAAGECKTYPRLGILYAYNYNRLGDSIKAKDYMQQFLNAVPEAQRVPDDYLIAGAVFGKVPGFEDTAVGYINKAMELDTVAKNKATYIDSIASLYKRANKPQERLEWVKKSYSLSATPSNRDIFDLGEAAFNADSLVLADTVFSMYKEKFPDQAFGYYWKVKIAQKQDSALSTAIQPINDYIQFLSSDTVKNNPTIGYYHALLGGYYANVAKSIDSSIIEFQKAVQADPSNTQYQQYLDLLTQTKEKANRPKKATPTKSSGAKPKTGTKKPS